MLRRFFDYIDKVFDFERRLSGIADTRIKPHIRTGAVLLSSFVMQVTRLGSLNALAVELRLPKKVAGIIDDDMPSIDTIGRAFVSGNSK